MRRNGPSDSFPPPRFHALLLPKLPAHLDHSLPCCFRSRVHPHFLVPFSTPKSQPSRVPSHSLRSNHHHHSRPFLSPMAIHQPLSPSPLPFTRFRIAASLGDLLRLCSSTKYGNNGCPTQHSQLHLLPHFMNPNHIFTSLILQSSRALSTAKAILMNTFHEFESDTLASINDGTALHNINLPPILPIGPLKDLDIKNDHQDKYYLSWLDNQPKESVVYVSFGSRTAMSDSQIRELSKGLETSGYRFLWVLKTSKVDKDDIQEVSDMVGESFMERTKNKGIVLKAWVSQQDILEHPAIGGFVNHCGWNSVMEAAREGIPVLAWPQHGDQSVNAEIVEKAGLGIWERKWGWGLEGLVSAEEIRNKIVELMEHEKVRSCSKKVGEEARKASGIDGRSEKVVKEIMQSLMQKRN
ncbi:hypothetical protein ACLB2K_054240 [Fragaria x ananassa]